MIFRHIYPPSLLHLGNKTYIVPTWQEVPNGTLLEDIKWEKETFEKKEIKTITKTFVSSSDSSILYKTEKIEQIDGTFKYNCNCPGRWRAKDKQKGCKHMQAMRNKWLENQ